jgi:hypothetical protein
MIIFLLIGKRENCCALVPLVILAGGLITCAGNDGGRLDHFLQFTSRPHPNSPDEGFFSERPPLEKPVLHVFGRFLTSNIRYRTYGYQYVRFYAFVVG